LVVIFFLQFVCSNGHILKILSFLNGHIFF
jgi:hypothetical protein